MKRILTALVLGVTLLLASGGVGYSQDLEKAWEAYEKGDFATALREFRALAEQGNWKGQAAMGFMYSKGHDVTQNYKEAAKWYRKSAVQGDVLAQIKLGKWYSKGQGVLQDSVYAHMWFNIAAFNGHPTAEIYRDDIAKSMTKEQLAEAQKLARECVKKNYKGC